MNLNQNFGPLETVRTDDYIEYFLFPNLTKNDDLQTICEQIQQIAVKHCENYIWHKDTFHVTPRYGNANLLIENQVDNCANSIIPPHIYGITHYEDNIQDEWLIVSLLFEISKQIPDLIIRCVDGDGEFMLIEAADYLPKWANPDTCDGCLFIFNGSLHLIDTTKDNQLSSKTSLLPLELGLNEIRQNAGKHQVSESITNCIGKKIADFPSKIVETLHCTTVYLPIAAAALLRHNPQLISLAVHAFCNRDQIDLKACRAMKHFPPENRVYTRITFTKCLYAMLMHNNYLPDRRIGWNLPKTMDSTYKAHLLGIKLACGFEIILATQSGKSSLDNFANTKSWQTYLKSLQNRGYFQEFLENSKDYTKLLQSAKEYYSNHIINVPNVQEYGANILSTLKSLDYNVDEFSTTLPNDDDSDDWMNISSDDLDNMLAKQYGIKKTISSGGGGGGMNGNLDSIAAFELTDNIAQFLEKKSDFIGAEVGDESDNESVVPVPPQRTKRNNVTKKAPKPTTANSEETDSPIGTQIDFNPDAFQNHLHEMLNLVIPDDNWESTSDMSDFDEDTDLERNINDMDPNNVSSRTEIQKYMDQMDRELAQTTIGQSFQTTTKKSTKQQSNDHYDDNFEDIEDFTPVDIDVNALQNMAHSYQSQFGGPGPASNLLGSMGIKLKAMEYVDDFNVPNTQV